MTLCSARPRSISLRSARSSRSGRLPGSAILLKIVVNRSPIDWFKLSGLAAAKINSPGFHSSALLGFALRLGFVLFNRQPLQVLQGVRPLALQWLDVVNLPARAGQPVPPCRRAGLLLHKSMPHSMTTLNSCASPRGYCESSYEYESETQFFALSCSRCR